MSTKDDGEIWQAYAKSVKRAARMPVRKSDPKHAPSKKEAANNATKKLPPLVIPRSVADVTFARNKERQLREGDIELEGRIDLHGLTQTEAFAKLETFITRAIKTGKRNLLVITGKGSGGRGALRTNLRGWLETIAGAAIIAVRASALRHGGNGAFYVILKRQR